MADFKSLKGLFIKHVSSDPSNLVDGEIWYNTSSQSLKCNILLSSWASGGNLNALREVRVGEGTQTAAIVAGGSDATPNPFSVNLSEEYDGSSWTEGSNLNTARLGMFSFGALQTSAVAAGGATDAGPATPHRTAATEEYNGSSWSNGEDMGTARFGGGATGLLPAGLAVGGTDGTRLNNTEEYDGTDWTAGGNYVATNSGASVVGTQTSALAFGGSTPDTVNTNATYDGSSWTTIPATLPTVTKNLSRAGTTTAALGFGGYAGADEEKTNRTMEYDGTSWSNNHATLATARGGAAGCGTQASALLAGGVAGPGKTNATEEFTRGAAVRSVDTS